MSGYVQMMAERLREAAQRVCDKMKMLRGFVPPAVANVIEPRGMAS